MEGRNDRICKRQAGSPSNSDVLAEPAPDTRGSASATNRHHNTDWLSKVQRPTKHIIGHIGDNFYRSYDQTNSVKALKETSWFLR